MNDHDQLKFEFWNDIELMDLRSTLEYLVGIESVKNFDEAFDEALIKKLCEL